ncbi:MAG: hypothetical protein PHC41_12960 [Lachnospiraceae bacterium]|nr:hypothetical protein [Lachnospiraceae bacterium]MDD3617117.1 hypothetical protein [Lachnospiraceae bacterium]
MSSKIDSRVPKDSGAKSLDCFAAIQSPWNKLVGYQESMHWLSRYNSTFSAACMQALRILEPEYAERAQDMCTAVYQKLYYTMQKFGKYQMDQHNIHPFCRGSFVGALVGDSGDDALMMCGRVQDFGTYRAEKELDICDWDIVGSELCRATTQSLEGGSKSWSENLRPGTQLEYHMVEARGCGDCHCRIVAESRDKYPMPPHAQWECFGPIATADQIKDTKPEDMVEESMVFRGETGYTFANGTNMEDDSNSVANLMRRSSAAAGYIFPTLSYLLRMQKVDEKTVDHVFHCVCEAAGKAAFGERVAIQAVRDWMGVPNTINDGRVMGGYLEMYFQAMGLEYTIEAFNKDEVQYVVDRNNLTVYNEKMADAFVAYWYGMTKTLVNAQWFLWEIKEDTPADKLRIRIAKKIDKFC